MNCPKCNQPIEPGAVFCGNCGQQLAAAAPPPSPMQQAVPQVPQPMAPAYNPAAPVPPSQMASQAGVVMPANQPMSPIAQVYANQPTGPAGSVLPTMPLAAGNNGTIPAYAVPALGQQSGHMKATIALVCGILGIVGALFIPLVGLGLGITGIVLATLARRDIKHGLSTIGLIVSILAILAGLATWAYAIEHDPLLHHGAVPASNGTKAVSGLSTPCYKLNFASKFNIENSTSSCDMNAYNGSTFDNSTDAYKVLAGTKTYDSASFDSDAKQALEQDIKDSLPSFTITDETSGQFAASPAYFVTAQNGKDVTLIEAIVVHQTAGGQNFFVMLHAVNGSSVDLKALESGWQWQ